MAELTAEAGLHMDMKLTVAHNGSRQLPAILKWEERES